MENINVFKRYELKYIINEVQKDEVMKEVRKRMSPDPHGESTIRNIYFDTPTYLLIRNSIDKPVYKEKFRMRSYSTTKPNTPVFAEIKKKYKSVVYKRRLDITAAESEEFIVSGKLPCDTQIAREINQFFKVYEALTPKLFISYDRKAFYDGEFKATFDENICYRTEDISLSQEPGGKNILPDGYTLMELKTPEAIPLWMTEILTRNRIFKTSFSKYGEAYKIMLKEKTLK